MKEKLRNLLETFLDKPTDSNLELLNDSARAYTSYWIDNIDLIRDLDNKKTTAKNALQKIWCHFGGGKKGPAGMSTRST